MSVILGPNGLNPNGFGFDPGLIPLSLHDVFTGQVCVMRCDRKVWIAIPYESEIDALQRDVQALHPNFQDMDWLLCSNNSLTIKVATVNLTPDFKVSKEMFEGIRDSRAHLMQYNDYMNVLGAFDATKCKAFSTTLKDSVKD
ncbi:hypothetical protein PVK06_034938 [Gossypium arboreum]|uniref:Uncharacterized protein n=1 Tax=Gossypium arboreum TaxID=29729 RepID=A0ABR0NG20_GOSAR|nr:hypothetical protein PVK06_034938 [Gossypium arboreum]